MFAATPYAEDGGLMSYATLFTELCKGANSGDLPVEQATRFELVANTKTAKAIGVRLRDSTTVAVDRVIE